MRNLLYIANVRMPTDKAYGIQITKMCEAFADRGVQVELVIPNRRNAITGDLFDYYDVKRNFRLRILQAIDFYFPGRLNRIAVTGKNFLSAITLSVYGILKGADLFYSRDDMPLYFISFFKRNIFFEAHRFSTRHSLFYRRFVKLSVRVVAISSGLRDEFIRFGFRPENVLVANDGVDLEQFDIELDQKQCRHRVGLPEDRTIIGYVGQLRTMGMEKGISELLEAFRRIREIIPDILLVIVGGGADDIEHYRKLSVKSFNGKGVVFVGRKKHADIPFYLKSFDVLTMPFPYNRHYAFYMSPLKLFEYMASGRPIVASDLPTIRDVLSSESTVLVNPDDSGSLATGIVSVLQNPEFGRRLARRALDDARGYSWYERAGKILRY